MIKILDFFKLAGGLKRIPRSGWVKRGVPAPESVADHTFRTTLMAMVLSDMHGLDTQKAMRMTILHDLAEVIIGDPLPKERSEGDVDLREKGAMKSLLAKLPEGLSADYSKIWQEFSEGTSEEARLVREVDTLERMLQAFEYKNDGAQGLEEFWNDITQTGPYTAGLIDELLKLKDSLGTSY
jgi:putative hydrolase of HD superfamily